MGRRRGPDRGDSYGVGYNRELGRWTFPFIMAAINTRVVRRSAALLDHAWGARREVSKSGPDCAGPWNSDCYVPLSGAVVRRLWGNAGVMPC